VAAYQDCAPLLYNNVFHDNRGVSGGGVLFMNSTGVLLRNTLVMNRCTQGGGAVYLDSSPVLIEGNVFAHNAIQGAIYCLDDDRPAVPRGNLLWENEGGARGGACADYAGRDGNCEEDPRFEEIEKRTLWRSGTETSRLPGAGAARWDRGAAPAVPDSVLVLWRTWITGSSGP
jgi:hypothetical protein